MAVKKKVLMPLGIAAILIIGGIIMFNPFTGKDEPIHKHEQDRIVQYIREHIELVDGKPIKKIEFVEFQKNDMTGTWRMTTTINSKYNISFSENEIGGEIETANYSPKEFKQSNEKIKSNRMDNVEIVYYY
ncbi:hypothetical protein [Streptococcus macacae]|uniref:DUF1433 domain-containing protein n=1 Tax=Streptococcus macacae NCTC 11558 TaxID=764298 RepID=G5JVR0_9STRE|nr:hypothetical protein [Streptococcus macacae]EHJ52287.1 hypothetical protein STRMA_0916 [Streptococcus macacae NCTC 11558]SUN78726.1 membrane protein [Streptococcus macacae NCTC 11558]